MKFLILFWLMVLFIGVCFIIKHDDENRHYKNLHKEHQQLMEGQKKLMEGIKMSFDKSAENGKKLDILLNIATNRVDNINY